jgi:hypothetical protein
VSTTVIIGISSSPVLASDPFEIENFRTAWSEWIEVAFACYRFEPLKGAVPATKARHLFEDQRSAKVALRNAYRPLEVTNQYAGLCLERQDGPLLYQTILVV